MPSTGRRSAREVRVRLEPRPAWAAVVRTPRAHRPATAQHRRGPASTAGPSPSRNGCHLRRVLAFGAVLLHLGPGLHSVFDVSDPRNPRLTGKLGNLAFENEAMSYGERRDASGKVVRRFVLVGIDLFQVDPRLDRTNVDRNVGGS